jgi:hypothetical protein
VRSPFTSKPSRILAGAVAAMSDRAGKAALATLVAAAGFGSGLALGGEVRAQLAIGVFVRPVAVLDPAGDRQRLLISPADVERGYVDVESRLSVRTTSRDGFRLDVRSLLPMFRLVELTLPTGHATIGPEGGSVIARVTSSTRGIATPVNYRFHLNREVVPGIYPFPLALSVHPL